MAYYVYSDIIKHVFHNGRHDGRPFGVPNNGLANPALRRRKSKNRSVEKFEIIILIDLRCLLVRNLSTGGIEK